MAKHPVPKKKMSNSRTASRYASFATKKHLKINKVVSLVKCSSCGNAVLTHYACQNCGTYRDRSVVDYNKKAAKITKVKA